MFIDRVQSSDFKILSLCLTAAVVVFILDIILPLGAASGVLFPILVMLTAWAPSKWVTITISTLCSAFIVAGFFLSPEGLSLWFVIVNRGLLLFVLIAIATLVNHRRAALEEVTILKGFLPICSTCKKIRDESDTWHPLESYIRDHSEAELSHGFCPTCFNKTLAKVDLTTQGVH